jgi:hypothetical protein
MRIYLRRLSLHNLLATKMNVASFATHHNLRGCGLNPFLLGLVLFFQARQWRQGSIYAYAAEDTEHIPSASSCMPVITNINSLSFCMISNRATGRRPPHHCDERRHHSFQSPRRLPSWRSVERRQRQRPSRRPNQSLRSSASQRQTRVTT